MTNPIHRLAVAVAVVATSLALVSIASPESAGRSGSVAAAIEPGPSPMVDLEAVAAEHDLVVWVAAVEAARVEAERVEAERVEAERLAAARRIPSAPSIVTQPGGGHSDAWWYGVAICEQGGRNDQYYGFFSFMDGSSGGKTWDEQVAMGNALLARAGREVGPWAASCVAAGYRASPDG